MGGASKDRSLLRLKTMRTSANAGARIEGISPPAWTNEERLALLGGPTNMGSGFYAGRLRGSTTRFGQKDKHRQAGPSPADAFAEPNRLVMPAKPLNARWLGALLPKRISNKGPVLRAETKTTNRRGARALGRAWFGSRGSQRAGCRTRFPTTPDGDGRRDALLAAIRSCIANSTGSPTTFAHDFRAPRHRFPEFDAREA